MFPVVAFRRPFGLIVGEAFRLGFVEMDASIFRFDEHGGQFGHALLFQIHQLVTGYDCRFHP